MSSNNTTQTSQYVTAIPADTRVATTVNAIPVLIPQTVESNRIHISDNMIRTHNYKRSVMWFSGIDIFFSMIYCLYNPYFFIPLVIAFTGNYGARKYNICMVKFYFMYCVLVNIFGRLSYAVSTYVLMDNKEKDLYTFDFVWVLISTAISIWVCEIIYKFIKNYKKLSNEEIEFLKGNHNMGTVLYFY
tara:strand:- start:9 stop:572 length:564 start_codon:yes stop_codon:yes gene_type:complete